MGFNFSKLHKLSDKKLGLILVKSKNDFEIYEFLLKKYQADYVPVNKLDSFCNANKFIVNNSCSRPVILPQDLTIDLCKIVGALCADGHITTKSKAKYITQIVDGDYSAMKSYEKWLFDCFKLEYEVKPYSGINAWRIDINNKVLGRFLVEILDFPVNKKSSTVRCPELIRNSTLDMKRAFLIGLFTFDAGVNTNGNIEFMTRSKDLFIDVVSFLEELQIIFSYHEKPDNNGFYRFHTDKSEKIQKQWMSLFEEDTEKWLKLKDFVFGFSKTPENENDLLSVYNLIFPSKNRSIISLVEVYQAIKHLKRTNVTGLADYLNIHVDTTKKYRNILLMSNVIKEEKFNRNTLIYFNDDLSTWKMPER